MNDYENIIEGGEFIVDGKMFLSTTQTIFNKIKQGLGIVCSLPSPNLVQLSYHHSHGEEGGESILTYVGQLHNGLYFPFPPFQKMVLDRYKISLTQIFLNGWRILTSYFFVL